MPIHMYPTLIVGVGGSGKLICKFLKKNFLDKFPKEWHNPATGLPPIVSIIVIETEPGKEKEELDLPELPDVPIIAANIDESTLKAMQRPAFLRQNPDIKNWLAVPPNLPIDAIIGGAGQIRQAGRLAFFRHRRAFGRIETTISAAIQNVKADSAINSMRQLSRDKIIIPDTTVRCYIISSVCGGTGSGMLLDIAGLINKKGCKTNLIALLPKMFESVIDVGESIYQLCANTYATLKEINHYMTGGKWGVWYDSSTRDGVFLERKLFDYCFLVEKENGTTDLRDRLHISPLLSEFLFHMINGLEHSISTTAVNYRIHTETETSAWCNGLGISTIYFPLEEICNIMINWAVRDLIKKHLSANYDISEINDRISNSDTGLLCAKNSYITWEEKMMRKSGYSTLSAETIIRQRGSLYSKIQRERDRIRREQEDDFRRIKNAFNKHLPSIIEDFSKVIDDSLKTRGLDYTKTFAERLTAELENIRSNFETQNTELTQRCSQLNTLLDNKIELLSQIGKKKTFVDFGWYKRVEPHVENILVIIRNLFDTSLAVEKHRYSQNIIVTLKELVNEKVNKFNSLANKLNLILTNRERDDSRLWSLLGFSSEAEIKVKSNKDDVQKFYDNYLKNGLREIGAGLRQELVSWIDKNPKDIDLKLENAVRQRILDSGFDRLTILDAMSDDMNKLDQIFTDCLNKSLPFIRHAGQQPVEFRVFISGFEQQEIERLPSLPNDIVKITSEFEKTKRRLIFIRLSANISPADMAAYDFDKYAMAYGELVNRNKWIHILPEALGFEDPLGLSVGMEEESLIKTCLDVGIIFQKKGHYFEYKDNAGKVVVLAQGLENAIRKLQDEPEVAKYLRQKLVNFFNNQTIEWIQKYLENHDRKRFVGANAEENYRKNHEKEYRDAVLGTPTPANHSIPTYIITEIKKRLKNSGKLL